MPWLPATACFHLAAHSLLPGAYVTVRKQQAADLV